VFFSGILNVVITRENQVKIQSLTIYETTCTVKRDGVLVQVTSKDLVPGDLVMISEGNVWVLPCDLVIVKGTCICDESGLTGESMPVRKSAIAREGAEATRYDAEGDAKHTLFAGTTVLQAGNAKGDVVEAVVTETGIRTVKGDLISNILVLVLLQPQREL
jgi:cation-transporting ATPase 13A3/4/5